MEYNQSLQKAIAYMEQHLTKPISVKAVAQIAGYSEFHFIKLFKQATGGTVYQYVRQRRLSEAARLLLNTDLTILEISFYYQFESQAAFSRAFKEVYHLPPLQYRNLIKNMLNGGNCMSQNVTESAVKGWFLAGQSTEKYELILDRKVYHTGQQSASIKSKVATVATEDFGTLMQSFSAQNYLQRRMCFSAFVKAENVAGWAGLWFRIDNSSCQMLQFDNMQNRAIEGTKDWNFYQCVLDVPKESHLLNIGLLMQGTGQVWLDQVQFEEVSTSIPSTNLLGTDEAKLTPENLDFEA